MEWFVSRVLEREFAAPAVWSVRLKEIPSGDYDVLADLGGDLLYVELTGAPPKHVTEEQIAAFLEQNIARAGFVKESRVVRAGAFRIGASIRAAEEKCDLVFVDPPYAATREVDEQSSLARLLDVLQEQVTQRGVVVVRTARKVTLLESYGIFGAVDRRHWGTMSVTLLQARGNDEQASGH